MAVSKAFGQTFISLQFSKYWENTSLNYSQLVDSVGIYNAYLNGNLLLTDTLQGEETTAFSEENKYSQYQIGIHAGHAFNFRPGWSLTLGAEAQFVVSEEVVKVVLVPYFHALLTPRASISGFYLQKGDCPLSVFNGSLVINNYDKYRHRISLTGRYDFAKMLSAYLTWQWEDIEDDFLAGQYRASGFIAGLKIKL